MVGISIQEIQDLNFSHNICNLDFRALRYLSKILVMSAETKHVGLSHVRHPKQEDASHLGSGDTKFQPNQKAWK